MIELPYDEQVELFENTGVPIINEYHKVKLFAAIIKKKRLWNWLI